MGPIPLRFNSSSKHCTFSLQKQPRIGFNLLSGRLWIFTWMKQAPLFPRECSAILGCLASCSPGLEDRIPFVGISPLFCQTGFYRSLLNEVGSWLPLSGFLVPCPFRLEGKPRQKRYTLSRLYLPSLTP